MLQKIYNTFDQFSPDLVQLLRLCFLFLFVELCDDNAKNAPKVQLNLALNIGHFMSFNISNCLKQLSLN